MQAMIIDAGLAVVLGAALGLWFFGGLLWTVRRLPAARYPVMLVLGSFAVRMAVVVAALIWLVNRHWSLPLVAMAGFVAVRIGMLKVWGTARWRSPVE